MAYRTLIIKGELWLAYPDGLRFPKAFRNVYPFRGRGVVSWLLYILNRCHLDRVLLPLRELTDLGLPDCGRTAFLWPSVKRSRGRAYGYRIEDGVISEYVKIAFSAAENEALNREVANVAVANELANGCFAVPRCRTLIRYGVTSVAYFDPLPDGAKIVPITEWWYGRLLAVCEQLSKAGYMHGDFAWHNFKRVGDTLWILDWEEMRKDKTGLVDRICLEATYRYYWKREPLKAVLDDLRRKYLKVEGVLKQNAIVAIKDLATRNISMGRILHESLKEDME